MTGRGISPRCCLRKRLHIRVPGFTIAVIGDCVLQRGLGSCKIFDIFQYTLLELCIQLFDQLNGSNYVSDAAGSIFGTAL